MSQIVAKIINPAAHIRACVLLGGIKQRDESARLAQLGVIRISNRCASRKSLLRKSSGSQGVARCSSFGVAAATFQTGAAATFSFIYLTKQYFSGCRMWQSGDSEREFHHILQVRSRLA